MQPERSGDYSVRALLGGDVPRQRGRPRPAPAVRRCSICNADVDPSELRWVQSANRRALYAREHGRRSMSICRRCDANGGEFVPESQPEQMTCKDCGETKPRAAMATRGGSTRRRNQCIDCRRQADRRRYRARKALVIARIGIEGWRDWTRKQRGKEARRWLDRLDGRALPVHAIIVIADRETWDEAVLDELAGFLSLRYRVPELLRVFGDASLRIDPKTLE